MPPQPDFIFLFGADAARKHNVGSLSEINKFLDQVFVLLDSSQGVSSYDNGVVSCLLGHFLVTVSLHNFHTDAFGLGLLENEHVHCVV